MVVHPPARAWAGRRQACRRNGHSSPAGERYTQPRDKLIPHVKCGKQQACSSAQSRRWPARTKLAAGSGRSVARQAVCLQRAPTGHAETRLGALRPPDHPPHKPKARKMRGAPACLRSPQNRQPKASERGNGDTVPLCSTPPERETPLTAWPRGTATPQFSQWEKG